MSSVTIIIAIIVLLATLLCYAFIAQTVTNKRQQRARILAGFLTRSRNFKFMLNGFPKGFLPKELTLLVQRSLLHVCEQLTKLEPRNDTHRNDLALITQQMALTQKQTVESSPNSSIDNPKQSQEIKACLEELYKFVFHLEGSREMTRSQANTYRAMIKHLVLQLTVDSYALHGRIAKDKDKKQLALHYFNLAINLMLKEKNNTHFTGRINQLKTAIANLQEQLRSENDTSTHPIKQNTKINTEWDDFKQENKSDWQKKKVYD
jgi:hypothetical protein